MAIQDRQPILLLIDGEPFTHRHLTAKLRDENIEFLSAFSAEEGLELSIDYKPFLILTELNLPGINGIELLRSLKQDSRTMGIPVIIFTEVSEPSSKVQCFELGAMDYVVKGVDFAELQARIRSAMRITRLMNILEDRAQIDGLTGLMNRAYFDQRLLAELSSAQRKQTDLALVMCDLDRFKILNDTFGHPAGDEVLQSFAGILQQEIRGYDIACRYGGEEFALILPSTGLKEAASVCERIRKAIEAKSWSKYPELCVTASFGVTMCGIEPGYESESWIRAADIALYAAKSEGRNRVVTFTDDLVNRQGSIARAG